MSDYGQFSVGGVSFPVDDSPFVASITALDPVLARALVFYKAMLETHLGAYFAAMVTDSGATNLSSSIVAETVGYDVTPYLTADQYKFPLLAMYSTEEEIKDHTVAWYKSTNKYVLLYVLPPLTAAQANKILPILKGIKSVIVDRTIQGYDPAYQNSLEVWADVGVMEIGVTNARYGALPNVTTNLTFPALELSIECQERENANPGLDTLSGLDTAIDVSNSTPADDITVAEFEWQAT